MQPSERMQNRLIRRRLNILTLASKHVDTMDYGRRKKAERLYNCEYKWLEENGVSFHFDKESNRYVRG